MNDKLMLALWDTIQHYHVLYGPVRNTAAIAEEFERRGGEVYWNEYLARELENE